MQHGTRTQHTMKGMVVDQAEARHSEGWDLRHDTSRQGALCSERCSEEEDP